MNKIFLTLILLIAAMLTLLAFAAHLSHDVLFWAIEALGLLAIGCLVVFYRKTMRPTRLAASGMQLLAEQDFSSRLQKVGERNADRVVDVFNRMME